MTESRATARATAKDGRDASPSDTEPSDMDVKRIVSLLGAHRDDMVALLTELASIESPSLEPDTQKPVQDVLRRSFEALGLESEFFAGTRTGGHLHFRPAGHAEGDGPVQVLIGHTDTVWPVGTLERMPVVHDEEAGGLRGPGVFDMKAGLVQMVFALRALSELDLLPSVVPTVFVNSDEEIGSTESQSLVERFARGASRVLVLEPALGPEGRIKTTRRGVGEFAVRVIGKAAHSGLAAGEGVSAIHEMSHVIQALHDLTDTERGIGVNVGTVSGGTRPNVVAAESRAVVDVRVSSQEDARSVEAAIRSLEATTPGTCLEIEGAVDRAPMEATPANQVLWKAVKGCGHRLGLNLVEGCSGGASDGNTTSLYTATIDGLGAVGDGAHALHEHIHVSSLVERTALLALTLMLPSLEG